MSDFGVARAIAESAAPHQAGQLTESGFLVGTPAYMSPEQASGDADIDGRSDIYSIGCVLYEMLAGRPPFTGPNARAILSQRFREAPPALGEQRPDVPPALEATIARALQLNPAERFATAEDLVAALQGVGAADARPSPRPRRIDQWTRWSIGVFAAGALSLLAFFGTDHGALDPKRVVIARMSNETGDTTLSYLGLLATDRLTEALARTPGLRVVTSATIIPSQVNPGLRVDTLDDPARLHTLAEETAAGTLISGSYFRQDGRLSFQAEITDANSGIIVSAIGPIEVPAAKVESAVDSLSRRVADALGRHLVASRR